MAGLAYQLVTEERLPGGFVTAVARVGGTVRRAVPARAGFVHALLRHLQERGWPGAPRYLGLDEQGKEVLTYLDGHVPWSDDEPAELWSAEALAAVGGLVRELHDLTAGSALAGDAEVVCHNDLSPRNTVYRDAGAGPRPVAFLDWDIAAPGERIADVAHACWQYAGLGPGQPDPEPAGRMVRAVCDGYGLAGRGALIERVLRRQEDCWRGIEAGVAAGDPAFDRLREAGAAAAVRGQQEWTRTHRAALERALRP